MIIHNEKFQVETGHAHVTVLNVTQQVIADIGSVFFFKFI